LSQFEGLSYDETADVLGISTSTVRGRISRARQQLLEQLKGWA
jgi:RNA polymerase sigma-70 factor (ECF subfamily)